MSAAEVTRRDREAALYARFPYLRSESWSERTIAFVERGDDDERGDFAPEARAAEAIATARAEGYAAAREDAAKVCEVWAEAEDWGYSIVMECAERIRNGRTSRGPAR